MMAMGGDDGYRIAIKKIELPWIMDILFYNYKKD
jgi:hypothetical protein